MSLTLRALGLRICYFLGYYKGRVDALEARIKVLEEQNKLLGSTTALYVQYCEFPGCDAWCIDGDDRDYVKQGLSRPVIILCVDCDVKMCRKHIIETGWSTFDDHEYHCDRCFEVRKNQ
jgi:hypothetical protein